MLEALVKVIQHSIFLWPLSSPDWQTVKRDQPKWGPKNFEVHEKRPAPGHCSQGFDLDNTDFFGVVIFAETLLHHAGGPELRGRTS